MKRVIIKDREFKVIPEARLVAGSMPKKYMQDEIHEVDFNHLLTLISALSCFRDKEYDQTFGEDILYSNAYCNEDDEWDERTGIEVCNSKMDYKQHIRLAQECDKAYRLLTECADWMYKRCAHHMKKAELIDDDMCKTYGRTKV